MSTNEKEMRVVRNQLVRGRRLAAKGAMDV